MTTQLLSIGLDKYSETMTSPENPVLAALNRETHVKVEQPVMLSGHLQGAVLSMISRMVQPSCILEIGTYTGYSAICLAQGLKEGGALHTLDINEELTDMCRHYWREAGLEEKIIPHTGKAIDILPGMNEVFDLVFIDADKVNYSNYYDLVIDKVRPGGWIIADNVLYNGEVILPADQQSRNAKAMHSYNEKIKADSRVVQVLLPIRDGLLIAGKIL